MAGTYGCELDPAELTPADRALLQREIRIYREVSGLVAKGDYYRLSDPYRDGYAAWGTVSKDGRRCLLSAVAGEDWTEDGRDLTVIPAGIDEKILYRSSLDDKIYPGGRLLSEGVTVIRAAKRYDAGRILFEAAE